jgi:hypothetical protein
VRRQRRQVKVPVPGPTVKREHGDYQRTAEARVKHILVKLGFNSRAHIAA